jgi:hypothetical protein
MYFLDLGGLIRHLSLNRVTQRESLQYFFAFILLDSASTLISQITGTAESKPLSEPEMIVVLLVACAVVLWITWAVLASMYNANGGDQGEDFLPNLFAIGFVVSLRVSLLILPALVVLRMGLLPIIKAMEPAMAGVVLLVVMTAFLGSILYLFFATRNALRAVRRGRLDEATRLSVFNPP